MCYFIRIISIFMRVNDVLQLYSIYIYAHAYLYIFKWLCTRHTAQVLTRTRADSPKSSLLTLSRYLYIVRISAIFALIYIYLKTLQVISNAVSVATKIFFGITYIAIVYYSEWLEYIRIPKRPLKTRLFQL